MNVRFSAGGWTLAAGGDMRNHKIIVFALLCIGCIAISFNIAAISAVIPVISLDLGLPDFRVAKIISYYLLPYGIGALIYAPLTRFVTYRKVIAGSMCIFAASCFICGGTDNLNTILAGRIVMGISAAGMIPLGLMVIGEIFEKHRRGRLVGIFFSCAFIASIAGLALSGVASWRWLFIVPGVLGLGLTAGVLLFSSDVLGRVHVGHINYMRAWRNVDIRRVFMFIFAISFLYHGVHKWYGIYLSRVYHLNQFQISVCVIIAVLGGFVGQILGGVLSDKKGRLVSCWVGLVGLSLGAMLLAGHYSLIVLGGILVLVSMGWTIGHNGISTVLTDFSDLDRPMIASLNSSVRFISGGLGFYVSQFFVERSFGLTFLMIGILMLFLSLGLKRVIPQH